MRRRLRRRLRGPKWVTFKLTYNVVDDTVTFRATPAPSCVAAGGTQCHDFHIVDQIIDIVVEQRSTLEWCVFLPRGKVLRAHKVFAPNFDDDDNSSETHLTDLGLWDMLQAHVCS
jgi:hypothetical protein